MNTILCEDLLPDAGPLFPLYIKWQPLPGLTPVRLTSNRDFRPIFLPRSRKCLIAIRVSSLNHRWRAALLERRFHSGIPAEQLQNAPLTGQMTMLRCSRLQQLILRMNQDLS